MIIPPHLSPHTKQANFLVNTIQHQNMSFVSQTVAGLVRNGSGAIRKCDCENYSCHKHHHAGTHSSQVKYQDYITLLQQCNPNADHVAETDHKNDASTSSTTNFNNDVKSDTLYEQEHENGIVKNLERLENNRQDSSD